MFQLLFWACAGYFMAKYFIEPFMPSDNRWGLSSFMSQMLAWYQGRWFVSAYLTLYILSPLINAFTGHVSERKLLAYIIAFYIFSTIYGWIFGSREFQSGLSALSLVGLYTLGAWLKKSSSSVVGWNKWYDFVGFIVCTLVLTVISALLLLLDVKSSIYGYLNPLVIIESMFLFQFFRKIDLRKSYIINFLAASAFAAFLLHCHPFVGKYFNNICRELHHYNFAILYVMGFITVVFILSVLIDKVRGLLWHMLLRIYCAMNQRITPPQMSYLSVAEPAVRTRNQPLIYQMSNRIHIECVAIRVGCCMSIYR